MKSANKQARGSDSTTPPEETKPDAQSADVDARFGDGRFRLAFDRAPIGLAIVGLDYRLLRVNNALCDALEYDEQELLASTFLDITHPDDKARDKELADQLFRGEMPSYRLEKRYFNKHGSLVWLDLTALVIRNQLGEPLYGFAMVENITERKRAVEALRTSEERYRSFIVNSSEGIWRFAIEQPIDTKLTVDEQIALFYKYGYLAECNDALARMYGHERADDVVGLRFGDFPAWQAHHSRFATDFVSFLSTRSLSGSYYRTLDCKLNQFCTSAEPEMFHHGVLIERNVRNALSKGYRVKDCWHQAFSRIEFQSVLPLWSANLAFQKLS